jgi:hypothetical protein
MPPALGSGLKAELEEKERKRKRGGEEDRHVGFTDGGGSRGKGGKGGKGSGHSRVGEPVRGEGEDDDADSADEYEEDEAEERIGRRKKRSGGLDGDDDDDDDDDEEDDEPAAVRRMEGDVSGEESDGEERFNEAGEVGGALALASAKDAAVHPGPRDQPRAPDLIHDD